MIGLEFILFGILKAALAGAACGAVISLVCLHWEQIVDWFRGRASLKQSDLNNVGFSLQERLASGDYQTVYGIFNTDTGAVLDAETVNSRSVDVPLAREHGRSPLLVYR